MPVTTNPQTLLASNTSAVYAKTQTTLGACAWNFSTAVTGFPAAAEAIRVVGAPSWTPRGASIIQRTDLMTPWGGGQPVVTGGLGWDITLQTELFWNWGTADSLVLPNTQLAPLLRAMPWSISNTSGNTALAVQPYFTAGVDNAGSPVSYRDTTAYACEPFSIAWVQSNGKVFCAYDCIAVCKFSGEYGQRVMLDWTIKGKWLNVSSDSASIVAPSYAASQPPLVAVNCAVTMTTLLDNVNAVDKWSFDTGWTLQDVGDTREAYGFGLGFTALQNYPSLELQIAEFNETVQPDWTQAQANTETGSCTLVLTVGSSTMTIALANVFQLAFPTTVDSNGHRAAGIKLGGTSKSGSTTAASITFSAA